MKKTIISIGCIVVFAVVAVIFLLLNVFNVYALEFNIKENQPLVVECGAVLPEVEAVYKGNLLYTAGKHIDVKMEGTVDLSEIGTYPVIYHASHNGLSASINTIIEVKDTTPPEIQLVTSENSFTSPLAQYVEEGYKAVDNRDGDVTSKVIREEKNGSVYYTVSDACGNQTTLERKIVYKDVVKPIITLNGKAEVELELGKEYVELGYVAVDDCDGDITQNVTVEGTVNWQVCGEYTLTYKAVDSYGNVAKVNRTVIVKDMTPPELKLKGDNSVYILLGKDFSEPGYTASDNIDGDITSKVKVSGTVNTKKTGVYKITYEVVDSSGNTQTVVRNVGVYKKQEASSTQQQVEDKVIYLTFDDGPSKYTEQLLNILDKYGVKATFFVTNQYPAYQHLIGETYRRGHTIAIHTYTHDYADIYASEEAYYADFDKIQQLCIEQTGVLPKLVRFPGGTSNTISKKYCTGIMTAISQGLTEKGYYYTDWNVSSEDAGGTTTREGVFNNVISGIQKNNTSIVLQHDIKQYSVEAVEDIILWGLANGYTFLPMTETSKMIQFRPSN